jgi:pyrroloquinoline quinone (PQQ) biosynthesis protein C
MRATVPLLHEAARRCRELAPADPVAARLAPYFERHAAEEARHDDWFLEDAAALGLSVEAVLERVPPPEVAALLGAQYYWIRHAHPVALLGCFAVLEGSPPTLAALAALERRSGAPARAFRTFRKHARLDPRHRADLDALVDELPLSRRQWELLETSAVYTADQLGRVLACVSG